MIQATGEKEAHSDILSEPQDSAKWRQNHLALAITMQDPRDIIRQ